MVGVKPQRSGSKGLKISRTFLCSEKRRALSWATTIKRGDNWVSLVMIDAAISKHLRCDKLFACFTVLACFCICRLRVEGWQLAMPSDEMSG